MWHFLGPPCCAASPLSKTIHGCKNLLLSWNQGGVHTVVARGRCSPSNPLSPPLPTSSPPLSSSLLRSLSLHPSVRSHVGVRAEDSRGFHDGSSSRSEDEEGPGIFLLNLQINDLQYLVMFNTWSVIRYSGVVAPQSFEELTLNDKNYVVDQVINTKYQSGNKKWNWIFFIYNCFLSLTVHIKSINGKKHFLSIFTSIFYFNINVPWLQYVLDYIYTNTESEQSLRP